MSNDISEQALASWNEVVRHWHEYATARYNFTQKHRSELLALVKLALGSPSDGHLAFDMAVILAPEEKKTLLPDLLGLCSSGRYAGKARKMIFDMPHDWLIENIEIAAEPALAHNDFLDWVNILSLFTDIDLSVGRRLAQRMMAHSDSELREWGQKFLNENEGA
jgi:hypothetical protein